MRSIAFMLVIALMLIAALFISPAVAIDPDEAVKARQAVLEEMGSTMKALGAIAKSDVEAERSNLVLQANKMRELAPKPWPYFGQETAVARVNSDAKASIWADPAGFKKAETDFIAAADALAAVAAKGDNKVVGEKIAALGTTCGACHKQFKK